MWSHLEPRKMSVQPLRTPTGHILHLQSQTLLWQERQPHRIKKRLRKARSAINHPLQDSFAPACRYSCSHHPESYEPQKLHLKSPLLRAAESLGNVSVSWLTPLPQHFGHIFHYLNTGTCLRESSVSFPTGQLIPQHWGFLEAADPARWRWVAKSQLAVHHLGITGVYHLFFKQNVLWVFCFQVHQTT